MMLIRGEERKRGSWQLKIKAGNNQTLLWICCFIGNFCTSELHEPPYLCTWRLSSIRVFDVIIKKSFRCRFMLRTGSKTKQYLSRYSLHSLHSSFPKYLTKTLLYMKQPTQKPAALSNHVNKLQVKAIAATVGLKASSLISFLNWIMMKQDKASIKPTPKMSTRIDMTLKCELKNELYKKGKSTPAHWILPHAKRFGFAGFQRGEGCKTTATRVAIMPRGAKGVNPNSILVTNSHETIPKMTFTRRRFLM